MRQTYRRSELAEALVGTNAFGYAYDSIGNRTSDTLNGTSRSYAANCLKQYTAINRTIDQSEQSNNFTYDADGNLARDDRFSYAYDAEDRLVSATSRALTNGAVRVRNAYDWRNRRISKSVDRYDADAGAWRLAERRDFIWDNWNVIHETIATFAGATTNVTEIQYFWGPDLSNSLQTAGGVGGLLAVSCNGSFYFPVYDNNGNVMKYVGETGMVVASYVYDAFGRTISQSGPLADVFRHRFSSKYFDIETGLYYYGYRFYHPVLMRWLTRDPIEERGGLNFYSFVNNNPFNIDKLGLAVIVLKHLPGENPPGGWMSSNHAALTVYNSPFYFVTPQTCSDGRLRFSVSIEPPNSFVHVYFRSANDAVWAMRYETDHIDIVRQYDEALYAFKRAVESIYDCPRPAREKWIAEERKLRKIRDKLRLENDSYDEEGGPHDLMEK